MAITHDNQLVLLHESPAGRDRMCLRTLMCANEPLGEIIIDGLCAHGDNGRVRLAAPVAWGLNIEDKQRLL
ncbi:MAG: hypothetical protein Q7T18_11340, partial [Sedimentisphaerales bacterium]|nr:hypothetical protein [Sedimentisphaerales bacterium]